MAKQQHTVLIINDAQEDRFSIRRLLRQDPTVVYQLLEAETWDQALHYLHQQPPDCLLVDAQLPETDWESAVQALTAQGYQLCPIIILTADSLISVENQALTQTFHEFLPKPNLTAPHLQQCVRSTIERMALLRHLEAEREWSRLALANVRDGVITTDLTGCVTYMNPTAEQLTGWSAGAAHGQPLAQIFLPLDETTGQPIPDPLAAALHIHQNSSQVQPALLTGPQGRTVPIAYQSTPIQDRQGTRSGIVLTFQDLSERKAAEETLHRREQMLRQIIDHVPGMCAYVGADGRYHFVNATSTQWFQRPRHQIIGAQVREMIGEQSDERVRPYRQQALAGETVTYETTLQFPDGINRTVWVQNQPDFADDGTVRGVYLYVTDISERKQMELDRQFLLDLDNEVRVLDGAAAILHTTAQRLGEYLGVTHCTFSEMEPSAAQGTMLAHWQRTADRPNLLGTHNLASWMDHAMVDALHNRQHVVVTDVAQDPRTAPFAADYQATGTQSLVCVPIQLQGTPPAILTVADEGQRTWHSNEVTLMQTVIARIWPLIVKARAEEAYRRQEQLFLLIADNTPGLLAYVGADERYQFVNATFERWFQRPRHTVVGAAIRDLIGEQKYAESRAARRQIMAGETIAFEGEFTYPDGVTRAIWSNYQPHRAADGTVQGYFIFIVDISARKQAEADTNFLANLAESIRMATDADALLWTVCQAVGDYLALGRCHFIEVDQTNDRAVIHRDYCRGVPSVAGESTLSPYNRSTWGELEAGRTLINHDAQEDPRTAAIYETVYAPVQERAYVGVPLRRDGEWQGVFSVTTPEARQWQPREIQLLETVAERTWLAVEKLRLDAALRASEEQLRQITNHVPGLITMVNEREEYEFANHYLKEWLGLEPAQIIGRTLADVLGNQAFYQELQPLVKQVLAGETVIQERSFTLVSGATLHILTTLVPRRAADGRVTGWYNLSTDITERKQAEADARFLADLAETIRLADDEATFWARVTQRIGDYLGVARCHFAEIDEANDRAQIHHDYCRGVPSVAGELPLSTFDEITWGELAAGRILHNHDSRQDPRTAARYSDVYEPLGWGAYVVVPLMREEEWRGALAVTTQDARQWQPREIGLLETVAERSWLAVEKLRLEAAVRASEEQLRQIADHLPGIISVLNEREEYEFVSRSHEEWLGRSRQEMLGHTVAEMIGEAAYATARPYLHRALAGETVSFENRLNTIHDGLMDVQVTFVPRRANGDPITGCYGLVVDITARKQTERMLQRFNEQLEQQAQERETELTKRLGELDQFAYVTSHDLKAPLRAIDHLASWISEDMAELLPPESRGHLEKMKGRIVRMERLLDDLLAYSRADRYKYHVERVDLQQLVDEIIERLAAPPELTIYVQIASRVLVTQKTPVEIILRHLISNAVKHHHAKKGQIQVAVHERENSFEITVQDDGPGIAPEYHERIFHLFQTLKPRDQVEASGMGLAIVKKIVESRGGRIVLDSTPGVGSKFTVTLPK